VPCAVAADLRKGPLENARATVRANGIDDKVQLRISDGLNSVLPEEIDDIVIAGMGGILIKEIIEAAPWTADKSKRLILQPQSHSENIREFLWNNGFSIFNEKACFEDEKVYIAFCAEYSGKISSHSDAEILFGGYPKYDDEASQAFTQKKLKRLYAREKALSFNNGDQTELSKLKGIINEVKKWQQ
jgi:tRNA (adenine22-N1)-methyltransferase